MEVSKVSEKNPSQFQNCLLFKFSLAWLANDTVVIKAIILGNTYRRIIIMMITKTLHRLSLKSSSVIRPLLRGGKHHSRHLSRTASKLFRPSFGVLENHPKASTNLVSDNIEHRMEDHQEAGTNPAFDTIEKEIEDATRRWGHNVLIDTTSDFGNGLQAARTFAKGDLIMRAEALASIPKDSHSIQRGWDEQILVDLPARFINHSCNANVGIKDNDVGAYDFFALQQIEEGEVLFWDYEAAEYEISAFTTCMCGDKKCRGSLGGFKKHGNEVKKLYGEYYANYLK